MKKSSIYILISIIIINFTLTSSWLIRNGNGAEGAIDADYGNAPQIDGVIKDNETEWDGAIKNTLYLKKNLSTSDLGLPIKFWVMQNDTNLYISIQFDLEYSHNDEEFISILISERVLKSDDNYTDETFVDAKVIYFTNITKGEFEYGDFYINNGNFKQDTENNGVGVATLEENTVMYEFSMPVKFSEDNHDVFLDYGEDYAFKILYGESFSSPENLKFEIVLVKILYPPAEPPGDPWPFIRMVLSIIIFSALGVLFGFYIFKISILKKKIERVRG